MKTAVIVTVYNEVGSIDRLMSSLSKQSRLPDQIIVTDAFSTDGTWEKLQTWKNQLKNLITEQVRGNRSIGRNRAFQLSDATFIAITDAGVKIDPKWFEEIMLPFNDPTVEVVAGFYHCEAGSAFEEGMCAYTATMPDQLDHGNFLPSARSMAMRRVTWEKSGGWDERLSFNEDLPYDYQLQKMGATMVTAPKALVYWRPRSSWSAAWKQFSSYARGDAQSLIFTSARAKVWTIFGRYIVGLILSLVFIALGWGGISIALLAIYALYAIRKNGRYVRSPQKYILLPLLQIWSDLAVMWGTCLGLMSRIKT